MHSPFLPLYVMHTLWHILSWATLGVGILLVALEVLWFIVRRYSINTTTAIHELPRLSRYRASGRVSGNAVVAGGSIAGLATAIVCSKFFERVIIVEPDSMVELKRTRVAQAEQIHGLQAISLPILRAIVPGFDARVHKHGGRILESNGQVQLGPTSIKFKRGSLPETVFISRLSLEQILREYVQSISTIEVIQGLVTGVVADAKKQKIEQVIVQAKGTSAGAIELSAAMFADCSGPATIGLRLLEKAQCAGWGPYPKTSYDPKISYATALIPVPDKLKDTLPIFTRRLEEYSTFSELGYVRSILPYAEQDDRMACMVRSDEEHLMCGIGGWNLPPDSRPRSFGDYIQQVDSIWRNASGGKGPEGNGSRMAVLDSLHAIETSLGENGITPEFKFCKMGPCYKIDYANAPKPSNFVAIGDSFLRVNPTFGQGISKALVDVASLNGVLLDTTLIPSSSNGMSGWSLPTTFSTEMLTRQIPRVMHMWDSTKDSDYGRKGTDLVVGESAELGEFGRRYWRRLVQVASQDTTVAADVIKSLQLVAPPLDLLRPSLFIRAMWCKEEAP